jgi:hypothetical protein
MDAREFPGSTIGGVSLVEPSPVVLTCQSENPTGVPKFGTPVDMPLDGTDVYFSPISLIFTLSFRLAWAAASLATGIR